MVVPGDALIRRAMTGPVIDEPFGYFATGTLIVCSPARGIRSPCQPETTPMRPSIELGVPLPRLGTEYQSTPFDCAGITIENVAMYSTIPREFLGAN